MEKVSGKRFARESFVAAKTGDKIIAPLCYQGTCNTGLFNMWIEKMLVPELRPGQMIIMDNATFHKASKTKELIERAECVLCSCPPIRPILTPLKSFGLILRGESRIL